MRLLPCLLSVVLSAVLILSGAVPKGHAGTAVQMLVICAEGGAKLVPSPIDEIPARGDRCDCPACLCVPGSGAAPMPVSGTASRVLHLLTIRPVFAPIPGPATPRQDRVLARGPPSSIA